MSVARPNPAPAGGPDRLILALFLAAALHAVLILGVTFRAHTPDKQKALPVLDITVVTQPSAKAPKDASYLAAANQDGTGNTKEKVRPQPALEASAAPPPPTPAQQPAQTEVLTSTAPKAPKVAPPAPKAAPPTPQPSATALVNRSLEMLALSQQINQSLKAYAKRPRQTYISASTRAYKYASYMNAWVDKVERVGDLNYPDAARQRGLTGSLVLDVAINPDGSIHAISLLRSSGQAVLDDAAIRIARLAAPYAPLPPDIRKDTDILHITRTWEFSSSYQLHGR